MTTRQLAGARFRHGWSRWASLSAVLGVLFVADTALACPSCKESLAAGQENLARGFYYSILFMMSMPFLILFGVGGYFYWQIVKARRLAAPQAAAMPATITTVAAVSPGPMAKRAPAEALAASCETTVG